YWLGTTTASTTGILHARAGRLPAAVDGRTLLTESTHTFGVVFAHDQRALCHALEHATRSGVDALADIDDCLGSTHCLRCLLDQLVGLGACFFNQLVTRDDLGDQTDFVSALGIDEFTGHHQFLGPG